MSADPTRWEKLRAVFEELGELPPDEQIRELHRMTFGDLELRAEVEALLIAGHAAGNRFDQSPAIPGLDDPSADPPVVEGSRIGPYRVTREIGRGGMGTVYEAYRDDAEYTKRVAIKMVAGGRDTDLILRRFRYERQILARLEHRNIAALLDGGLTGDGRPYFAMEYVEGERIDRYCDRHRLNIRQRLQLIRQICSAVHYAHQNLVVHRDLKPSNILVAPDGTVKLLDFGIAKVIDPGTDDEGLTDTGMLPMTTSYASPEQLRGEAVSTATDIYSLGVVLYELLAGRPPFPAGDLPVMEIRRRMLEETPKAPSLAMAESSATGRLTRTMAGELDNIVFMALRKEPERRYASAEQVSEDILRFLAGLPIHAQPDSFGYRARKFVVRNRSGVAATVIALLALVGGLSASLWLLAKTRSERARAQVAEETQTQVTEFFRTVLASAKPGELGPRATVIEAIDAATARLDSTFRDRPAVLAALSTSLAGTLNELGLYQRALPLARRAHEIRGRLDGGRASRESATSAYNLAYVLWSVGELAPAESLMRRSLTMYEEIQEDPAEIAAGYNSLASLLADRGQLETSVDMHGKALSVLRARRGTGHSLIAALSNYATGLVQLGRYQDALPLLRESVDRAVAERGPDDVQVGASLQPLAYTLLYLDRHAEADTVARRSYHIRRKALGPQHPETLAALRSVAEILEEQGRHAEAITALSEVIEYRNKGLEETDPNLAAAYVVLARSLAGIGKLGEAEVAAREALTLRRRYLKATHWLVFSSRSVLGDIVARRGRRAEAEPDLAEGLAGLEKELGPGHRRTREARARLDAFRAGQGTGLR